jgi:hypothetical protein
LERVAAPDLIRGGRERDWTVEEETLGTRHRSILPDVQWSILPDVQSLSHWERVWRPLPTAQSLSRRASFREFETLPKHAQSRLALPPAVGDISRHRRERNFG